ncbi:flippase [candidate division KSB1 bacterium]|nr:flippase [candidate division KSB1 bacterium]
MPIENRVAKNSLILLTAQIFARFIGFVVVVLLTRYLGTGQYGKYTFAFAFVFLFNPLFDLGITPLLTREVAKDKAAAERFLGNAIVLKVILALFTYLVLFLIINLLRTSAINRQLVYLASVCIILRVNTDSFIAIFRAFERMQYEALVMALGKVIESIAVLVAIYFRFSIVNIMLMIMFSDILILFVALFVLLKKFVKPQFAVNTYQLKRLIKGGLPFALTGIFVMIYFKIDSVMLSKMKGDEAVGLYNSAYNLIFALMVFSGSLVTAIFPFVAENFLKNKNIAVNAGINGVKYSLVLALPVAIGVTFVADQIIHFLYTPDYLPAATTLRIIIWVLPLMFVTNIFGHLLGAIDKQRIVFYIAVVNAAINILLNFILIPKFSHNGAALATVLTEIVGFGILFYYVRQSFATIFPTVDFFKILLASLLILPLILLKDEIHLLLLILFCTIVYLTALFVFKAVAKEDVLGLLNTLRAKG